MKGFAIVLATVCICRAQTFPQTPSQVEEAMERDLRGTFDRGPWALIPRVEPPRLERPTGASISVAALQHKVPRAARKSFARAKRLSKSGDHAGAAAELETTIRLDPRFAAAYNALGAEYLQFAKFAEARMPFERALELNPDFVNAHYNFAVLLLQTGDTEGSEKHARRVLQLASNNPYAHWLFGYLLYLNAPTRTEGLEHIQYAARTLRPAKQFLKELPER